MSFNRSTAKTLTLDAAHGTVGLDFNVDHLAVTETDPFDNLLCTKRLPSLREDASFGQRNAALSDPLTAAVEWAKEMRKPVIAEEFGFTAKKKAVAKLVRKEHTCSLNCSMRNVSAQVSH